MRSHLAWLSSCLLSFAAGCSSSASSASDQSESWPSQWTADIAWSDFAADGTKTNTWTGKVSYDWPLHAMRTDVTPPPAGGMPGPPIGEAGTMLMRSGLMYFMPKSGGCSVTPGLGAPVLNWLAKSSTLVASTNDTERWSADLSHLGPDVAGCFTYVRGTAHEPRLFGGSSSCTDWPRGSYVEYSNFAEQPAAAEVFDAPLGCTAAATDSASACAGCHESH